MRKKILIAPIMLFVCAVIFAQNKPGLFIKPIRGGSGYDGRTVALLLSQSPELNAAYTLLKEITGAKYLIDGEISLEGDHYRLNLVLSVINPEVRDGKGETSTVSVRTGMEYRDSIEIPAYIPYLSRTIAGEVDKKFLEGNIAPGKKEFVSVTEATAPASVLPTPPPGAAMSALQSPRKENAPDTEEQEREVSYGMGDWRNKEFAFAAWGGPAIGGFTYEDSSTASEDKGSAGAGGFFFEWRKFEYFGFRIGMSFQTALYTADLIEWRYYGYQWIPVNSGEYEFQTGSLLFNLGPEAFYKFSMFEIGSHLGICLLFPFSESFADSRVGVTDFNPCYFGVLINPFAGINLGIGVLFIDVQYTLTFTDAPRDLHAIAFGFGYKFLFGDK